MERLDKIISATGKKSRREVREMVRQGRVLVDGKPAPAADMKVDPQTAVILLDGEPLGYEKFTYVMLHKPAGVLTATEDRRQETVLDLLPPELRRRALSPVGRLDKDTEGLLLLTNDGQLAHRLLSPKSHVDKVYYARVDGALEPGDIAVFAAGMTLGDGWRFSPQRRRSSRCVRGSSTRSSACSPRAESPCSTSSGSPWGGCVSTPRWPPAHGGC